MASEYFDSSIEFPELDILTGLPIGAGNTGNTSDASALTGDDWQKQLMEDSAKALDSGTFVNPMDIATQEENKKLRKQLEDLRAEFDRAQAEYHEQQDKYVEVLRQINDRNQAALEEQRVQHEKQMAEMNSHFEALQTASRNAGEKETELRAQLDEIRSEKESVQRKTEELQRELDEQRRLAEEERRRAAEEKDRLLSEARESSQKMADDASSREEELKKTFEDDRQGLLNEIEAVKSKAAEDAESLKTYYEDKLREEIGLKDAELAAVKEDAENSLRTAMEKADRDMAELKERADQDLAALREQADQEHAALKADAESRISEMLAENQKLQDEGAELARSLDESSRNNEQLTAALGETKEKLEYSESEQAKREIEASRKKLEEEAALRDQKIAEAKQIIQKQWSKIQDDRALIEAEKEVLSKERADAEEEKRRAVSWQQDTLTERFKLQDAQKKLASDQEEMDLLRENLEKVRGALDDEQARFAEEKEAYERRVEEETAERQRQIAAAREFLEKQHRESEEERANVMMERLSFEKEREDAFKQLESERNEFEGRKRRFREELERLTSWEGFHSDSWEEELEAAEEPAVPEEPLNEYVPEEPQQAEEQDTSFAETPFPNDFFQIDPVENVFEDEPLPSQDRTEPESSDNDEKSVMASPFADLFTEPSLTESLFASLFRSEEPAYPAEERTADEEYFEPETEETEEVPATDSGDAEITAAEAADENAYKAEEVSPEGAEYVQEPEELSPAEETVSYEDNVPEMDAEPAADETEPEPVSPDEQAEPETGDAADEAERAGAEENAPDEVTGSEPEDLTATLAFEIEQKVSELMDTVAQSEVAEPVLKQHTKENLFDTLAEVGMTPEELGLSPQGEDIAFEVPSEEPEAENISDADENADVSVQAEVSDAVPDEEYDDEPFDFDAVTDALNVAMLEKEEFSYTENNTMTEGDTFLIAEGITSKYYVNTSSYSYPVFREASFICPSGSCTAVLSDVPFCSYALLRAIASPEELAEGTVYVAGRRIEPGDYLYIGSDRLLPQHTGVLEWLVDNAGGKAKEAQKRYQDLLKEIGISKWAGKSLDDLSYSRRILVLLLSCADHKADLILINDPDLTVNPKDEMVARRIFAHLHDCGKTVMIASPDIDTVQSVASRVIVLKNSAAMFAGTYRQFMERYSAVSVSFPMDYADEAERVIGSDPRFTVVRSDDECTVKLQKGHEGTNGDAIRICEEAGVPTEQIRNIDKTFADACREALET